MGRARVRSKTRHRKVRGGVAAHAKRLEDAGAANLELKVGLPAGSSPYPDGTSVIAVGAIHEFGDPQLGIPERSWLRSSFREGLPEYRRMIEELVPRVSRGEMKAEDVLELVGLKAAADAQAMIVAVTSPPNSEATIRRKGSSNPLIDTGHLRQAVTHRVGKKER